MCVIYFHLGTSRLATRSRAPLKLNDRLPLLLRTQWWRETAAAAIQAAIAQLGYYRGLQITMPATSTLPSTPESYQRAVLFHWLDSASLLPALDEAIQASLRE
jgi:hypothetical protein